MIGTDIIRGEYPCQIEVTFTVKCDFCGATNQQVSLGEHLMYPLPPAGWRQLGPFREALWICPAHSVRFTVAGKRLTWDSSGYLEENERVADAQD